MSAKHLSLPHGTELLLTTLAAKLSSVVGEGESIPLDGSTHPVPVLAAKFGHLAGLYKGPREAKEKLRLLVAAREEADAGVISLIRQLHGVLVGVFGEKSPKLAELGFKARRKRAPLTAEQLTRKAARARLTRALRHTLGEKQKEDLKVHGEPDVALHGEGMTITPAPVDAAAPVLFKDLSSGEVSTEGAPAKPAASGADRAVTP